MLVSLFPLTFALYRFGMAEQAINTIYLLGEQPDALCGDIIKSITRALFASTTASPSSVPPGVDGSVAGSVAGSRPATPMRDPSATPAVEQGEESGNAFQLSQLVFLVGHVAFKHIVYLELVEREIKRRKEVLAKGTVASSCSQ